MGPSGSPADYPAAQPTAPSLAGAYPTGTTVNLVTVVKTLTTYEDWVWSHPDPSLVTNYEVVTGNTYTSEVRVLTQFGEKGLHAQPLPTEIDFVRVASPAVPQSLANGKPVMAGKYRVFRGAIVTVVFNEKPTVMLTSNGASAGQDFTPSHLGPTAYSISLVQGADGRYRFDDTTQLNPPGGIASVEGS
jgi:hypothetical protein